MGRRLRWHLTFSKFNLTIDYIPGKENLVPDALSGWAYPAGNAWRDISKHGSLEDVEEDRKIKEQEEQEERESEHFYDYEFVQHSKAESLLGNGRRRVVSPVDSPAESSAGAPPRFTFKQPRIPTQGQAGRAQTEPRRKSPPSREVGPREEVSEEIFSQVPQQRSESSQENFEEDQSQSQGGELQDAPLGSIYMRRWGEWYVECPRFGSIWEDTFSYSDLDAWPENLQVIEGRMFIGAKLCVPTPLQKECFQPHFSTRTHLQIVSLAHLRGSFLPVNPFID